MLSNKAKEIFSRYEVKMKNGDIGEIVYVPNLCAYAPVVKVNDDFFDFSNEKEASIKEFL